MAKGRNNKVLFDLIPQRTAQPASGKPVPKPVVRVDLQPSEAAEPVQKPPYDKATQTPTSQSQPSKSYKPTMSPRVAPTPPNLETASHTKTTQSQTSQSQAQHIQAQQIQAPQSEAQAHAHAANQSASRSPSQPIDFRSTQEEDLSRRKSPQSVASTTVALSREVEPTPVALSQPRQKASPWPAFLGTNNLAIPVNVLYLGVALLLVCAIAVYALGVSIGEQRAAARLASGTLNIDPKITEPGDPGNLVSNSLSGTISGATGQQPRTNPGAMPGFDGGPAQQSRPPTPKPVVTNQTPTTTYVVPVGGILTSRGVIMSDPRVPELNYLALASLAEDDAKAAIAFLSVNGIDAIGIQTTQAVDRSGSAANNQGPARVYRLYSIPGISRDEFSQKLTARTNVEANVARIGNVWQKEHRGASNFSRTQWEKYRP